MDSLTIARNVIEAGNVSGDWQPLIERLADDVVFKVTMPGTTPIPPEVRGKQAVTEHLINLGGLIKFTQEKPLEYFGNDHRVVVLGQESMEIMKTGETVPASEYATVLDFRDGQITLFLVIQDMSAFVAAYRDA